MPIPLVILLVCAIGAVIGLINGIIIAYLNVTPFITTLHDGHRLRYQLLYYDFGASPISGSIATSRSLPRVYRAGLIPPVVYHLLCAVAVFFVWIL